MKKHWWIVLILVFALAIPAMANQAAKVVINGQELKTDVPAQNVDGRILVPLRAISEYFGKDVAWDAETKTATITGETNLGAVEKISAQWAASGHASTDNPLNYAGGRDGCQPCHSGNGFARYFTDNPFTPQADAEDGATAELASPIDCATCHTGLGKELIETDMAKAELIPFASEDFEAKNSALCMSCHNGRRDAAGMYEQWASGAGKPGDYPHHDAGALFTGKGGMEYPDVTYGNSMAHQSLGCTSCHMPKTEEGFASHGFNMDLKYVEQTCGTCHAGATDFTVGGNLKAELDGLLTELEAALLDSVEGAVRIGTGHSDFPFVDAEGNKISLDEVSLEAFVGAYNYVMIATDGSNGAHNPKYAKSLLEESIKKLK